MEKENFCVPTRKNWPRIRKFDDLPETVLFSDIIVSKQVDRTMNFRFVAVFCITIVVYKQFLCSIISMYIFFDVKLTLDYDSDVIWLKKVMISTKKLSKMVENRYICRIWTFFWRLQTEFFKIFEKWRYFRFLRTFLRLKKVCTQLISKTNGGLSDVYHRHRHHPSETVNLAHNFEHDDVSLRWKWVHRRVRNVQIVSKRSILDYFIQLSELDEFLCWKWFTH